MTATQTVTNEQITALADEAANAGDIDALIICQAALDGDTDAVAACGRMIADASADAQ